jgi:hypothetical protein
MKEKAYLFGPFIGELFWELMYFAPFAIYKKYQEPTIKTIVFTRPSRFDLYGRWANILVPLKIKDEEKLYKQNGFGLDFISNDTYRSLGTYLKRKYLDEYTIKEHFIPDITGFRGKVKWQFLRDNMLYEFKPRRENSLDIRKFVPLNKNLVFVDTYDLDEFTRIYAFLKKMNYYCISNNQIISFLKETDSKNISYIGYLMEISKNCKFVISNFSSLSARVALLSKIPVISIKESMSDDSIHLLNPFNIPVIKCKNIEEGVEIYENTIRS